MEKQIISKLGRRSKGNFFYHRVETEAYVKTYICGIRTRKRPVNPCKFIGIKMNEQENNLKTWIEEKINMEYEILESKISKMLENDRLAEIKKQSDKLNVLENTMKLDLVKEINNIKYALGILIWRISNIEIMSQAETIDKIIKNHCSVARFGDGEVNWMLKEEYASAFQKSDPRLKKRLGEIFVAPQNEKIIICLSHNYVPETNKSEFWTKQAHEMLFDLCQNIVPNRKFGDTDITRNANNIPHMKQIWKDRDIIIVEGELSRLGVGNDLFDNAKDIRRILCLAKNAFDKYDEIFAECLKQPKEKLLLLALGPTATVLAYDLYRKGYQAIDVGHIDICYEWKLRGATGKIAVPGKYVNEVPDGRENIEECTDRKYLNSIIAKIS